MLAKIVPFVLPCTLAGTYYYLRENPIPLDSPHLTTLFRIASERKPEYALTLFKVMLKMKIIQTNEKYNRYVLASGFDADGSYLDEISTMGFGGMEVGPISLNPTTKEQESFHLGIKSALAKICTHKQAKVKNNFQVQLKVVPNYEVAKYAPYLIKQNLLQVIEAYCQIQQLTSETFIDKINIEFDHPNLTLEGKDSPQVRKMISETQTEIAKLVKQLKTSAKLDYSSQRQPSHLTCSQLLSVLIGQTPL